MPPQKLKGKDYSSDVILQSNKKQVNNQARANTYDFWLSGHYGKYNKNIYSYSTPCLGALSLKNDELPLNSLFWSPPPTVHRFDASDMAVPEESIYFLIETLAYYFHYDRVKNKPLREKMWFFLKHPAVCQIDWKHRT